VVPIEPSQRVGDRPPLLAARDDVHLVDDAPAPRQVRRRSAGVREDVFDAGRSGEAVAVVHLCHRPGGIRCEIDQGIRQAKVVGRRIRRGRRVDEHHCLAPLHSAKKGSKRASPR